MKTTVGALIQPALLDQPGLPHHLRVYRTVHEAIASGTLPAGSRLPSARRLAMDWGVTRGAVDAAFDQLYQEGLVVRRVGDGSYVASPLPGTLHPPGAANLQRPLSRSAQQVLERFSPYMGRASKLDLMRDMMRPRALFPRTPYIDDFPLPAWRRLIADAYADEHRDTLSYGAAVGLTSLRQAVARHLNLTRGTPCSAEQVIIVNSPMQGIELVSRVLLEPGDQVWVEDPGFASLPALFRVLHQEPVPVPLDDRGLVVAEGRRRAPRAAAVYFHPLVQFPTGQRTDAGRRRELIDWADEAGAWIVEANFNDELAHDRSAPECLRRLDRNERVLTMGTFEGIVFPSLRVAYLVVPERLLPVFVAMRGLMGDHTSVAVQHATARLLDEGHLARRLRGLRQRVADQTARLAGWVCERLPAWVRLGPTDGDGHTCLHFPPEVPDMDVARELRARGVSSFALSSTCMQPYGLNGLAVCYGPFAPADVERAIDALADVLKPYDAAARPRGVRLQCAP
ncbi:MAG: PLP-dependent aminotransferase family protein [Rubrivivax sp.]|nr:PLP-dependent aminotransferase family protein [Rubrivivax sp.]